MRKHYLNRTVIFILIGSTALSLASCAPRPFKMAKTPEGPPEFKRGWEDGCETGMATESNTYYKSFYKFKQDPYSVTDPMYFGAWFDAYRYCRDYVDKWTFDEMDAPGIADPNQ